MSPTTAPIHSGRKGDTVVVAAHRVGHAERIGEILEVLGQPDRVHYRVLWSTGQESVLYPSSDATIRPTARRGKQPPR